MNLLTTVFWGALLLLFTLLLPALTSPQHFRYHLKRLASGLMHPPSWRALFHELDGVTITYTSVFTGNGSSTAPTAIQASALLVQTAEVFFADADATATIVHNWGSVTSFPPPASWASFLLPYISFYALGATTTPSSFATNFTFGISNTNSITMNKIGVGTGSGGTWAVVMRRA